MRAWSTRSASWRDALAARVFDRAVASEHARRGVRHLSRALRPVLRGRLHIDGERDVKRRLKQRVQRTNIPGAARIVGVQDRQVRVATLLGHQSAVLLGVGARQQARQLLQALHAAPRSGFGGWPAPPPHSSSGGAQASSR